ncbi:pentatricopeptide repeat-containing protein At3g22470, mitochondrial-like [Papaver somniferum]|uniref:pentatricopeptide repeat-containing protein At3g22470, mitochondrial-like n=1 Tax=Papaver somniferum TaxID=3469 RepID=UPI000E6FFA53|nr:pentatricopeptide repeat-containing protein At3g22470, mitochondrial-like [Papaver somniferum]XP_026444554.1 pentatricopeptide repeat-containing protein At3g22470, mitochondrial-like [Papaver somniferum]
MSLEFIHADSAGSRAVSILAESMQSLLDFDPEVKGFESVRFSGLPNNFNMVPVPCTSESAPDVHMRISRIGKIRTAVEFSNDVKSCGRPLSLSTCNGLLDGLFKNHEFDKAIELLYFVKENGLEAELYTYNIATDGLFKAGELVGSRKLFCELRNKSFMPDVRTFTIMIDGLCKKGMPFEAEKIIIEMEKNGCLPDAITYCITIQGFINEEEVHKAKQFFHEMLERGFVPSNDIISLLKSKLSVDQLENFSCFANQILALSETSNSSASSNLDEERFLDQQDIKAYA